VLGLFDNCVFTVQCWDGGVGALNNAFVSGAAMANTAISWAWISQAGADYGNSKIVYLSPQLYGLDFGVQYAPNMGNSYQLSGLGVGCNAAGPTCISTTSGNDATRWYNQVGAGLRFQQTFGAVDVKAFGFYETAGKENLTAAATVTPAQVRAGLGGVNQLRYDNLNFGVAGLAVTAFNTTLSIDYSGGAMNGGLIMRPTGGVSTNAFITGIQYANGPWTAGFAYANIQSQGAAQLTGISQRNEQAFAVGGAYRVAPGLSLAAEYQYIYRHQGGYNFQTATLGTGGATSDAKGQGILFTTALTW